MAKIDQPQKYNNPFAIIDETPDKWVGLVGKTLGHFLIFDNPENGVRAGIINLYNAYLKRGLDTIEKIFPVYAPLGHGNNVPEDYIKRVVQLTGIGRNEKIVSSDQVYRLGKAIVEHEEGEYWLTPAQYDNGFKRALDAKKIPFNPALIGGSISIILILIVCLIIFL